MLGIRRKQIESKQYVLKRLSGHQHKEAVEESAWIGPSF
jgi:hypothetical protein